MINHKPVGATWSPDQCDRALEQLWVELEDIPMDPRTERMEARAVGAPAHSRRRWRTNCILTSRTPQRIQSCLSFRGNAGRRVPGDPSTTRWRSTVPMRPPEPIGLFTSGAVSSTGMRPRSGRSSSGGTLRPIPVTQPDGIAAPAPCVFSVCPGTGPVSGSCSQTGSAPWRRMNGSWALHWTTR